MPTSIPAWLRRQEERWSQRSGPVILAGTGLVALLIGLLVATPHTFRSTYSYREGDFATATVRAPWDFAIRDDEGTARKRDEAARVTPPVAAYDPTIASDLPARIARVFTQARDRIGDADDRRAVPPAELARLSAGAKRRLQQERAREADQAVQAAIGAMLPVVERQLAVSLTPDERTLLGDSRFAPRIEEALVVLVRTAHSRPIARGAQQLRDEADRSRGPDESASVELRFVSGAGERTLPDAAMIDDVPGAVERMRARAPDLLPGLTPGERTLLVGLASRLIRPDTTYDEAATARRRSQAVAAVPETILQYRRNELIVQEGHQVTREAVLVLDYLRTQTAPTAFSSRTAGATAIAWIMLAALLWLPARLGFGTIPLRDAAFALFALAGATLAYWVWLFLADGLVAAARVSRTALNLLFPVSAVPMLAGLVLRRQAFLVLCLTIALSAGTLSSLDILYAAHAFVIGLVAGQLVVSCRQRSCVIRAGGLTGLVAFVTGLGAALLADPGAGMGEALLAAAAAAAGAAAGGLVAIALGPPVEWLFGYSSKLGLVEMLSYDHPLLRQFMERAPGTFQHSVAVAVLAQHAAEAIGADSLLIRVGALYHDVGKMDAPQFFTENNSGDVSPHDAIDPRASARVILAHPERGAEFLMQHRMAGGIIDFAREHHGTGTLASFLQKAEAAGAQPDPEDYRYAGPKPRSRETALLMMADRIEATARSRRAATDEEFRAVVTETVDDLLDDGQLDDAPLTLKDLARLEAAFATTLSNLHHRRVAYPAYSSSSRPRSGPNVAPGPPNGTSPQES